MAVVGGASTAGAGGSVSLLSGASSGAGSGSMSVGTAAAGSSGASGDVTVATGGSTSGNTGSVTISSGTAVGGSGGDVQVSVGDSDGAGGSLSLSSGTSSDGNGGAVSLSAGAGSASSWCGCGIRWRFSVLCSWGQQCGDWNWRRGIDKRWRGNARKRQCRRQLDALQWVCDRSIKHGRRRLNHIAGWLVYWRCWWQHFAQTWRNWQRICW